MKELAPRTSPRAYARGLAPLPPHQHMLTGTPEQVLAQVARGRRMGAFTPVTSYATVEHDGTAWIIVETGRPPRARWPWLVAGGAALAVILAIIWWALSTIGLALIVVAGVLGLVVALRRPDTGSVNVAVNVSVER